MIEFVFENAERLKEPPFTALLDPVFREWVNHEFDPLMHQVLAAWDKDQLVGLGVFDKHPDSTEAELQSIEVISSHQNLGLGHELVRRLERQVINLGGTSLTAAWKKNPPLEKIFKAQGWTAPELRSTTYFVHLPEFNPTWFSAPPPLLPGYTLELYANATKEEKEQLESWAHQQRLLLTPSTPNSTKEPLNYLLLKKEGQIIGWMETHRISPESIEYTSLFLFRDHRGRGLETKLLAESIRLQRASHTPIALFIVNPHMTPLTWQHFVTKRLKPHAYHFIEMLSSFKKWK